MNERRQEDRAPENADFPALSETPERSSTLEKAVEGIREHAAETRGYFEDFHRTPELGGEEYETAARVKSLLEEMDIEILGSEIDGSGEKRGTGIVAIIHGRQDGPTIALRADMDALPVMESAMHPVRSERDGMMHACGHDAHTAGLLGAARALQDLARKGLLDGDVVLVFQPSEEKAHQKESVEHFAARYFWLHNNYYEARQLTAKYFQREILSWKKGKKPLEQELRSIEETPKRNAKHKRELFRRFHFSRELRTLLTVSEDFTYWQDERKRATYLSIHIGCTLLNEVAKRTGYSLDALKYCIGSEVETALMGKVPTRRELAARSVSSVFIATRDGYFVETGAGVKKVQDLMFGQRRLDAVQDVRGLSACVGRAVGTVKVVLSSTEIGKVQKGDILLAVMTRPDYVPAMRKAAAIVTNEGGITSHAAIVSRELGIPCIIGTKIATQIFKDGDLVEVNANHGWIRKVQA